jgi:hypothetical protein
MGARDTFFPTPWRDREARVRSVAVLAWVAVVNVTAWLAVRAGPQPPYSPWSPDAAAAVPPLARWDSGYYADIAQHGYGPPPAPGQTSRHAFFPLYSLLMRAIDAATALGAFRAGLVVSALCLLFAVPLFVEEGRARHGEPGSRALPLLLLYPTAFFFAAVYTESLFLLLALLAFREVRLGRFARALIWASLLGWTRPPAAFVGPALGLAWMASWPGGWRVRWRPLLLALAPGLAVAVWVLGSGLAHGEPLLFFRAQRAWSTVPTFPLDGVRRFFAFAVDPLRAGRLRPTVLYDHAQLALFTCLGAYQLGRRSYADAAWILGFLGHRLGSGNPVSLGRYVLVLYPAYYALAEVLEQRPRLRAGWLTLSGANLLFNVVRFALWKWVA